MIENKNDTSRNLEKALQALEQAKQRVANEKKKQNEKKRKAEKPLHHNPLSPMPKMKARAVHVSVDPENEHLIQEAISELTYGKTLITISHRLATIESADQILVIDGGTVTQKGTHAQLLNQEGTYCEFVRIRKQVESWDLEKIKSYFQEVFLYKGLKFSSL